MARAGILEKVGPGRYRLATSDVTESHSLLLACSIVPSGVVCLSTALLFHNLGTQLPHEVWLAVPRGTRVPSLAFPPVRVTRIAPALFDLGIEEHRKPLRFAPSASRLTGLTDEELRRTMHEKLWTRRAAEK